MSSVVNLWLLLSGGHALSPELGGIAISPIPSVSGHEQKWEETLSQVPSGQTVELRNYTGSLGFSSEMVRADRGGADSRESGHLGYPYEKS